jgi:hypothetical protein
MREMILLSQLTQAREIWTRGLCIVRPRRHGHQTQQTEVSTLADRLHQGGNVFGSCAGFSFFARKLHFNHDIQGLRFLIKTPGQLGCVHGLDHLEDLRRLLRFIGLQVPDQMESRARATRQLRALSLELLHVILAELTETQVVGFLDDCRWKLLGHREQSDVGALAARARRCAGDSGFHLI